MPGFISLRPIYAAMIDAERFSFSFARIIPRDRIAPRSLLSISLSSLHSARSNRWSNPDFLLIAARGTRACKARSLSLTPYTVAIPPNPNECSLRPRVSMEMKRHRKQTKIISPSSIVVAAAAAVAAIIFPSHFITRYNTSRGSRSFARKICFPLRPISKYFATVLMYFSKHVGSSSSRAPILCHKSRDLVRRVSLWEMPLFQIFRCAMYGRSKVTGARNGWNRSAKFYWQNFSNFKIIFSRYIYFSTTYRES